MGKLSVKQGFSDHPEQAIAIREVADQIRHPDSAINIIYFTNGYINSAIAPRLKNQLLGPVIGCSTAGLLDNGGYRNKGISGLSIQSDYLEATPYLIHPLSGTTGKVKKNSRRSKKTI